MQNKKISTRDTVLAGLFTALIAVGAFIRVPLPAIPFTMQIFFVCLAAMIMGRKAAWPAFIYMVLGLIGLPIFAKGGGIWYVFQPSFGYIPGFILGAYLGGYIVDKSRKNSYKKYLAGGFVSIAAAYACGMIYYKLLNGLYLGNPVTANILWAYLFIPFIPGDAVSAFLAAYIAKKTVPALGKLWISTPDKQKTC